jgi:hypothetical protein
MSRIHRLYSDEMGTGLLTSMLPTIIHGTRNKLTCISVRLRVRGCRERRPRVDMTLDEAIWMKALPNSEQTVDVTVIVNTVQTRVYSVVLTYEATRT